MNVPLNDVRKATGVLERSKLPAAKAGGAAQPRRSFWNRQDTMCGFWMAGYGRCGTSLMKKAREQE